MKRLVPFFILFIIIVTFACKNQPSFEEMIEQELASGIRNDSLFMDFYFGMPRKEFHAYCFQKNKEGILTNGPSETTVQYRFKELKYPATLNFYPKFHEQKICEMSMWFSYEGWAPWNKELSNEKLQEDVVKLMEKWYKKTLKLVSKKKIGLTVYPIFGTVDGNRAIKVEIQDQLIVKATLADLSIVPENNK